MLIQHLRTGSKNAPVATLLARNVNGKVVFSCSVCHKNDQYCKKTGIQLALSQNEFKIPACWKAGLITARLDKFVERATKYFKDAEVVHPV